MRIIVKNNLKDFFGNKFYYESIKENATLNDVKKAFMALKKDPSIALEIGHMILYWNTIEDFENKKLTARKYERINSYNEFLWEFEACKKHYYDLIKQEEEV